MKTIKQTYIFNASVPKVWKALTDPQVIEKWGGGPCKMDDKAETEFSLWGGSIWGENKKVVKNKLLVQDWYSDEDPKWKHPSVVTFKLTAQNNSTRLDLIHENVPDQNAKDIDDGWKDYYLGPLKDYLEKNS